MNVIRSIGRLITWLLTILVQIALAFAIIFLFSVIFAGTNSNSRAEWLALLFVIWISYVIGIYLAGQAALRWVWKEPRFLTRQRLIASAVGALIPLLILLPIGYSVPVGGSGSRFSALVTNNWQPILAQASLFAGIVGFYLPGVLKHNHEPVMGK
jgi:hypothetical protein